MLFLFYSKDPVLSTGLLHMQPCWWWIYGPNRDGVVVAALGIWYLQDLHRYRAPQLGEFDSMEKGGGLQYTISDIGNPAEVVV